jgi:hypothetical protein
MTPERLRHLTHWVTPDVEALIQASGYTVEEILENYPPHLPPMTRLGWLDFLAFLTRKTH